MTWGVILREWRLIERDLHEVYGIDAGDDSLMERRSWRWLRERILGLFDCAPIFVQNDEGIAKPLAGTRIGRRFQPD